MSERRDVTAAAPTGGADPRRWLFWPAFVWAVALLLLFGVIDLPLRTAPAPNGIVSYELAGTVSRAQAMLDSWDSRARLFAAFGLGIDYLFMPAYALAIGLAAAWSARRLEGGWTWARRLGFGLAWGQVVAALLDATENYALTRMLFAGQANMPWPAVAAACATIKFILVIGGLLYAAAGALGWLAGILRRR